MDHRHNRRQVALAFACLPAALLSGPGWAFSRGYTATTAPDALTRHVLGGRLRRLDQGHGADLRHSIHQNCARVIEQNIASRNAAQTAALWRRLSGEERRDLAQVYGNAALNSGRPPLLLDLLAQRLDGKRLGQVAEHFGFEPVYSALWRQARDKSAEFERNASPTMQRMTYRRMQFKPNVDMTLREIYQGFRTSAVGGLSWKAALYETSHYAWPKLAGAFLTGYAIGTGISSLLQTYAPGVHDKIGETIYNLSNIFSNADLLFPDAGSMLGNLQKNTVDGFELSPTESLLMSSGGDFGVTQEWADLPETPPPSGGGGCGRDGCPIME